MLPYKPIEEELRSWDSFWLSMIIKGHVDIKAYARNELSKRGLDEDLNWHSPHSGRLSNV